MQVEGLIHVATYRRKVLASTERVWENVLDWEHLPWLHDESFAELEHRESGNWGWRVELMPSSSSETISVELIIDAPQSRYVSRTTRGKGAGTEIWTSVAPIDESHTDIVVEFHLPAVRPDVAAALGATLKTIYTQLWDEDEQMMMLREARLATRDHPLVGELGLGTESEVRKALPLEVEFSGRPYRVVDLDGQLVVYSSICPHLLGPLGAPDQAGEIRCPWHGHQFDLRSRRSCDGRKARLLPAPRLTIDPQTRVVSLRAD